MFTSEWDANSQRTYAENFPNDNHEIRGDITKISAAEIPRHDLLLAGFPCQPFSIAGVSKKNALGRPHGFECTTQGTLFFDVARIIAETKPAAFVLENVKNLRSHDCGNTFRVIMETLQQEPKYSVTARVIDAKHFVPQHRERIIIIGFKRNVGFDLDKLELPSARHTLRDVLHPEDGSEQDVVDNGRLICTAPYMKSTGSPQSCGTICGHTRRSTVRLATGLVTGKSVQTISPGRFLHTIKGWQRFS